MLILRARVAAGWIDASEIEEPEPEPAPELVEGDEGYEAGQLEAGEAEVFGEALEHSRDA